MPGLRIPNVDHVAAVAGWPRTRSLFRTGWTSFTGDRVTVYHRLADVDDGPAIEVTTYVDGDWVDRDTASFLLQRLSALKSPPQEKRAVINVAGSPVEFSVLQAKNAWVAVSENLDPVITVFAREFPLGAVFLEKVAVSSIAGFDRLVAPVS
jgi:hypothetical protein